MLYFFILFIIIFFEQVASCALITDADLVPLVPLYPPHVKHMWAQLFLITLTGMVAQLAMV